MDLCQVVVEKFTQKIKEVSYKKSVGKVQGGTIRKGKAGDYLKKSKIVLINFAKNRQPA